MRQNADHPAREETMVRCTLRAFLSYFLRLGTFGFGGPIALAARMHKDLVEELGWISKEDYTKGLAFSQLWPVPLTAQLSMYLGGLRNRNWGATLAGASLLCALLHLSF